MLSTNIYFSCFKSVAICFKSILLIYLKDSSARQIETKMFSVKSVEVRRKHPYKFSVHNDSYYKVILY